MAAILAIYVAVASLAGAFAETGKWAESDEITFHLPQVNLFLEKGISLDYKATSATTPGVHWLVAGIAGIFGETSLGPGSPLIPSILVFLTLGMLALAWQAFYQASVSPYRAFLLCVPLIVSSNVVLPSLWLLTEAGAHVFYASILLTLLVGSSGVRAAIVFGLSAGLAALARQIYLPAALAYAVMAFHWWFCGELSKRAAIARTSVAIGIPGAVVAPFFVTWGGLVPPELSHHGTSGLLDIDSFTQALALLGLFAPGFSLAASLRRSADLIGRERLSLCFAVSVIAAVCYWWLVDTGFSAEDGRHGSLVWVISSASPVLFDRPIAMLLLIAGGAAFVSASVAAAIRSHAIPAEWILLGIYVLGVCGQALAWQRYVEVPILLTCGVAIARLPRGSSFGEAAFLGFFALYGVGTTAAYLLSWS